MKVLENMDTISNTQNGNYTQDALTHWAQMLRSSEICRHEACPIVSNGDGNF